MSSPPPSPGAAALLEPTTVGHTRLHNRVAVAPMTRISATADGAATDAMAGYYARLTAGGFGLLITEGIYPDTAFSQGYRNQPGLATTAHAASWAPVVDAVHAAGGRIFAQLMHAGGQSQLAHPGHRSAGPSAVAPRGQQLPMYRGTGPYPVPRAMTGQDIREVRRAFVAAARHATTAGFDGVEIHGANGYLLDQFLTDYTNHRDDHYGGTMANRVRLTAEICADVVDAIGTHSTVGVRTSQTKISDSQYRWPAGSHDATVVFGALARTGVHYLHTTEPDATAPAFADHPDTLAQHAKTHSQLPVIANGGLGDPHVAAALLSAGAADVIALGKPALADRDWVSAVQHNRPIHTRLHPEQFGPLADIKTFELAHD